MLTCYSYRQAATLQIGAIMMVIAAHYLYVHGEQIEFNCFEEGTLKPGKFYESNIRCGVWNVAECDVTDEFYFACRFQNTGLLVF